MNEKRENKTGLEDRFPVFNTRFWEIRPDELLILIKDKDEAGLKELTKFLSNPRECGFKMGKYFFGLLIGFCGTCDGAERLNVENNSSDPYLKIEKRAGGAVARIMIKDRRFFMGLFSSFEKGQSFLERKTGHLKLDTGFLCGEEFWVLNAGFWEIVKDDAENKYKFRIGFSEVGLLSDGEKICEQLTHLFAFFVCKKWLTEDGAADSIVKISFFLKDRNWRCHLDKKDFFWVEANLNLPPQDLWVFKTAGLDEDAIKRQKRATKDICSLAGTNNKNKK